MKKVLSLVLVMAMVLALAACGAAENGRDGSENGSAADAGSAGGNGSGAADGDGATAQSGELKDGQLLVGYAKVNITPEDSLPMGGYGNSSMRMSTGYMDILWATCIVLTDAEGNSAILFGLDLCNTSSGTFTALRTSLSQNYGIPESSIVFSASHTHSAPDMGSTLLSVTRYNTVFSENIRACVEEAMADRAPADIYINSVQTEGLNFVRRYVLEGNIYVGYQSDISDHPELAIIGHETDADPELQFVKFVREGDKKDVILANFQTHPHRGGSASSTLFTSDLVGAFRAELEDKLDVNVLYFSGASGNINPTSQIKEENRTASFQEQGKELAKYIINAEESSYTKVSGGKVQSATATFEGAIDHSQDHMVAIASQAAALWKQTNSIERVRAEYLAYGIHSPYHANAIISKAGKGEYESFDIWAISFGDVSLAVAPYEMFDTNGVFIKDNSPFAMTLVATCANGGNGYFPSEFACSNGGYEPDTTKYVHGSAENLADLYVGMMEELYKTK